MSQTLEFGNLSIDIDTGSGETVYTFKGEVNESFRQRDVPRPITGRVVLVLKDIVHFNSCGIREWIYLMKDFAKVGKVIFKQCSVAMVDQINMVPDSLHDGVIESFYAPYACEDHGEVSRIIGYNQLQAIILSKQPPELACEHCSKPLEFDALPQSYFLFASDTILKAS